MACLTPGGIGSGPGPAFRGSGSSFRPSEIGFFTVESFGNQGTLYETDNWPGVVCPKLAWRVEPLI